MADFSVKAILAAAHIVLKRRIKRQFLGILNDIEIFMSPHLSHIRVTGSILDELGINIKRFWRMEEKCVVFLQQKFSS